MRGMPDNSANASPATARVCRPVFVAGKTILPVSRVDVFPLERQRLADAPSGHQQEADRSRREHVIALVERHPERLDFGRRQRPVARFLADLLNTAGGVGVLRPALPRLEQIEQPR